ncbi:MAG: hypothetical protein L0154_21680, partial [Chloroflexi bacterium]|nr:hypothetical protein [Chloroflexota bacterium]
MDRRTFLKLLAGLYGSFASGIGLARANDVAFTIPPTVHHVTDTSAILFWRFLEPARGGRLLISQNNEV